MCHVEAWAYYCFVRNLKTTLPAVGKDGQDVCVIAYPAPVPPAAEKSWPVQKKQGQPASLDMNLEKETTIRTFIYQVNTPFKTDAKLWAWRNGKEELVRQFTIDRSNPARKTFKVVVQDSYETGGQNWTDDMMDVFKQRYGYDPLPYLPVLDGVVGSPDQSDRFLWDLRRLVADRVSYDYVGGLRDICHQHGLTTWLENYGHWGFPGEFLQLPDLRVAPDSPVLFIHRATGEGDIYFLSNQSDRPIAVEPAFRVSGKLPELWNPLTAEVRNLPEFTCEGRWKSKRIRVLTGLHRR